ncbi:MAG TPA: hypothetical protein VFC05_00285 [Nitrososphaeraceae archaeon]|nr:hypothetical protein [Nitrososphaeraceae archaeon]
MNKLIGTIIPIFLPIVLVPIVISLAFFLFIIPIQAEIKSISLAEKQNHFFSNISKDYDILNENFTIYNGLGIKLKYSHPWRILTKSDKSTCHNIDLCLIQIGLNQTNMPQIWIIQDKFESQSIKEYCKCNSLKDYENHFYKNTISNFDNFSFINENYTTFSSNKMPAIQLEYEFSPSNETSHSITLFTNNNKDAFYQFIYYEDPESFPKNFSNFQNIIDTVVFDSRKE